MKETLENTIIIDPDWPGCGNACDVREYEPGDDAALAAGRVSSRDLPLDGAWTLIPEYEWGDQKALCYARYLAGVGRVQIVKAHGLNEALDLDEHGNLWYSLYNEVEGAWVNEIVGL